MNISNSRSKLGWERKVDTTLLLGLSNMRERPLRASNGKWTKPKPARPKQGRRGAPKGNRNALKHGRRTRLWLAFLAEVRAHIAAGKVLIENAKLLAQGSNLAEIDQFALSDGVDR